MYTIDRDRFSPYLTQFPGYVRNGWFKSADPSAVVTCEIPWGLEIWVNNDLNCRIIGNVGVYEWEFRITTRGYAQNRQLWNVALVSDDHRSNFFLRPVYSNGINIGTSNGQEWQNFESHENESRVIHEYVLRIAFTANHYGTYRQNVVFGFGCYPVILKRICIDYMPDEYYMEVIQVATNQIWHGSEVSGNDSELVSLLPHIIRSNPRTMKLSQIYPYPDKQNIFLTQDTITDNWITSKNYRGRMHELITLEEFAQQIEVSKYNQMSYMHILKEYTANDIGSSSLTKYANAGNLFAQCALNREISEDTRSGRIFLEGCSSVLLRRVDGNCIAEDIFEAHVYSKRAKLIYMKLSKSCVDSWKLREGDYVQVELRFILNRLPFREWHLAVDSLENLDRMLFNKRFEQTSKETIVDLMSTADTFANLSDRSILNPLLNDEQRNAVAVITSRRNDIVSPILLLGPFGTGKTFTVAQVLRLLLQDVRNKIILCTHSNNAADHYITEFFDVWYKKDRHPRLKPIRVYYKERYLHTVNPVVQEYCLMDRRRGLIRNPTQNDFRDYGLIVTTLTNSSYLIGLNVSPTHIFIDEAAQAIECEALIALRLANPDTRVILAGDRMQLEPEICSELAKDRGFGINLLERICDLYPAKHPCLIQLYENYRAHVDIIGYMSDMFYEGKIKAASRSLLAHPIMKPLTFYAVYDYEIKGKYGGYVNYSEAQELANRVLQLKNNWPTDHWGPYNNGSIGVLSHYTEQVKLLRKELRKRSLEEVSVHKVINAHGKQFTAVFISTVRTRNCLRDFSELKDIGFFSNPRFLNTALTRARCFVTVVGDPYALLSIGPCQDFWKRYLDLADLHEINRTQLQGYDYCKSSSFLPSLNPLAREFIPRSLSSGQYIFNNQALVFQYLPSNRYDNYNNFNNEFYY